jgi:hypothetical protein
VHARCCEIAPALPPGSVFCHVTALVLLGIDVPLGIDATSDLHVLVPPGTTPPRRRGVVAHRGPVPAADDLRGRNGVPILAADAAWVQLGAHLTLREVMVLGDALTRRTRPWCSPAMLEVRVAGLPARTRGVRRLREAVALVRAGTDSCMESRLRWLIVRAGLPCPVVNTLVRGPQGEVVAMPDLAYPALKIAIEYDGDVHRTDKRTWRRDIARRQALEALGWRMITCTADDVLRTPDRTLTWIRAAIRASRSP